MACYSVCYVDGGAGGFSSELLLQCLRQSGCRREDIPAIMERVRVFRAFSVFDLLSLLHSIHGNISHQVGVSVPPARWVCSFQLIYPYNRPAVTIATCVC